MREPYLFFEFGEHPIQTKNSCVPYAQTNVLNKRHKQGETGIVLEHEEIAREMRAYWRVPEGKSPTTEGGLLFLKRHGYIKSYGRIRGHWLTGELEHRKIKGALRFMPLVLRFKCDKPKSKRVRNNKFVANAGDDSHVVAIWGTQEGGYTIKDSHYEEPYVMSEAKMLEVAHDIYYMYI